MNTDSAPKGFVNLSASDRELCDRIALLTAQIAALEPTDAAIYALQEERREIQQDLIFSKRTKGSRKAK